MTAKALQLRTVGHDLTAPFTIPLKGQPLQCEEILRMVPRRRLVCRAQFNGQTVLAKLFVDPVNALRQARRESRGLSALQAANLPTPKQVGLFTLPGGGRALLLEFLSDAISPADVFRDGDDATSLALLQQLFALLGQFHHAKLTQHDLHLSNFLLHDGALVAIDTADVVRHLWPLRQRPIERNLGILYSQFAPASRPLLQQALASYDGPARVSHEAIVRYSEANQKKKWQRRRKKIFRNCTELIVRRTLSRTWVCKRRVMSDAMVQFWSDPDAAIVAGGAQIDLLSSELSAPVTIDGTEYLLTRFGAKGRVGGLRPTRARVRWREAFQNQFDRIATADPIALMETRRGLLRGPSYFLVATPPEALVPETTRTP